MKRRIWIVLSTLMVVAVLAVVAGGCGEEAATTTTAAVSSTVSTTGATLPVDREVTRSAVYGKARTEGGVLFAGSGDPSSYTEIIAEFERLYGIKVTVELNTDTVAAQLISEASAGTVSLDVLVGEAGDVPALVERDLLLTYDWTRLADVDTSSFLFDGRFIVLGDDVGVFVYNTDIVAAADVPKTIEDLFDPRWKGKIGVSASGRFASGFFSQWQQDQAAATALISRLVANEPLVAANGVETLDSIVNGELSIGWVPGAALQNALAKGAPIAVAPFSPWIGLNQGSYVMKDSPHPNAALLLNAFLIDKGARSVLLQDPFFRYADEGEMGTALKAAGVVYESAKTATDVADLVALWQAGAAAVKPQ